MKIVIVAGTRPNFIKIAPLIKAVEKFADRGLRYQLVHTGQHYDDVMSKVFFEDLDLELPNVNLDVRSGTQAEQTGQIMTKFETYLKSNPCDLVLVVGDVNSTMACAIVTKKEGLPLIHVEAGIRSNDLSMPEEINRMVTDSITDHFYTTSHFANKNLEDAGISEDRIHFVGNVMIDTLLSCLNKLKKPDFFDQSDLKSKEYWLMTLHRPSNVDSADQLTSLLKTISLNAGLRKILFPIHPRTKKVFDKVLDEDLKGRFILLSPLRYLEFMFLVKNALGVITDSGGITEETTVLGVPCITLRENTERPETITFGTNELATTDKMISNYMFKIYTGEWKQGNTPELWDGKTAERIIESLCNIYLS